MFLISDNFNLCQNGLVSAARCSEISDRKRDERFAALKVALVCRVFNLKPNEAKRRIRNQELELARKGRQYKEREGTVMTRDGYACEN